MKQRRRAAGFGEYDKTANWGWMYNPPPYDFLNSPGQVDPNVNFYAPARSMGFSGLGCAGGCSCAGAAAAPAPGGLGLFDGGIDYASWGWAEYAAIAAGLYFAASLFGDTRSAVKRGRKVRAALR